MEKISNKQKVKTFEKAGYAIFKIGKKYEVCTSVKLTFENMDLISSNYLHMADCCPNCQKKILKRISKIKKRKNG